MLILEISKAWFWGHQNDIRSQSYKYFIVWLLGNRYTLYENETPSTQRIREEVVSKTTFGTYFDATKKFFLFTDGIQYN